MTFVIFLFVFSALFVGMGFLWVMAAKGQHDAYEASMKAFDDFMRNGPGDV